MGRKPRESTEVTKLFADQLNDLVAEHKAKTGLTQNEIAEQMGIGDGTLSAWLTDTATASIDGIYKAAKYFGVSADYLLGLSKIKSPDTNMQAACAFTGLTEEAIKTIRSMDEMDRFLDNEQKYNMLETLSIFISSAAFPSMMEDIQTFFTAVDKWHRKKGNSEPLPDALLQMLNEYRSSSGKDLIVLHDWEAPNYYRHAAQYYFDLLLDEFADHITAGKWSCF